MQKFSFGLMMFLFSISFSHGGIKSPVYKPNKFLFGPKIGFVTSILNSSDQSLGKETIGLGLNGGLALGYKLNNRYTLQIGAEYSERGGGYQNTSDRIKLQYLDIPILIKYSLTSTPKQRDWFSVFIGLQPSITLKGRQGNNNITDEVHEAHYDFLLGTDYNIGSRSIISMAAKLGFVDVWKGQKADDKVRNMSIHLTYQYNIFRRSKPTGETQNVKI